MFTECTCSWFCLGTSCVINKLIKWISVFAPTYIVDYGRPSLCVVAHSCKFVSDFDNLLDIEIIIHVCT